MTSFFATAVPGIGGILAEELVEAGADPTTTMSDGRNDIVSFSAKGTIDLEGIRIAEDLFVEVSTARRGHEAARVATALVPPGALERALSVAASQRVHIPANATLHVVARVRSEDTFTRVELREAVAAAALRHRPRWRRGDPAAVELWALETKPGSFRAGLRLTTAQRRQRGGRAVEREGALRPTVAAAMVRLAGRPQRGLLLDPCCGAGTIVGEAIAVGWPAAGGDVDASALHVARANLRTSLLVRADVHRLPFAEGEVGGVVSNLPFGHQFPLHRPDDWYAAALAEFRRVVAPGGAVVVLTPPVRHLPASGLREQKKVAVRLLGRATTLWQLTREG